MSAMPINVSGQDSVPKAEPKTAVPIASTAWSTTCEGVCACVCVHEAYLHLYYLVFHEINVCALPSFLDHLRMQVSNDSFLCVCIR
jgi:hypothetical protein